MTQYESMFEINFDGAENEPDQGYVSHPETLELKLFQKLNPQLLNTMQGSIHTLLGIYIKLI